MHSRLISCLSSVSFIAVLALGGAGCSTPVAVSPQGPAQNSLIASYKWGTLTGNIANNVPAAFNATNHALDNLGYYRVGQELDPATGTPTKATVYARGIQDVLVTVEMKPSKTEGMTELSVDLDPSDLPKAQAIYSEILKELGGVQRMAPAAPASGLSAPTRPQGS